MADALDIIRCGWRGTKITSFWGSFCADSSHRCMHTPCAHAHTCISSFSEWYKYNIGSNLSNTAVRRQQTTIFPEANSWKVTPARSTHPFVIFWPPSKSNSSPIQHLLRVLSYNNPPPIVQRDLFQVPQVVEVCCTSFRYLSGVGKVQQWNHIWPPCFFRWLPASSDSTAPLPKNVILC